MKGIHFSKPISDEKRIFTNISDLDMLSDWVSFLVYPNLFRIKGFVVVVYLI
jgi:hypothetical protein